MTDELREAFSTDYLAARRRFRDAAERLGWRTDAYPIGARGPQGEDLTIDVATSAPADRVLVVSSGLHGVEGHFGSAVQLASLDAWASGSGPPSSVRCVWLHALNPYGFAWSRRCDASNIDPNRNFIPDGSPYSGGAEGYSRFDAVLNPRRPPSRWDLFYLRALWAVGLHGQAALRRALVTGQYDFPKGLFFGGAGPSRTREILQRHLRSWIGEARTAVHLDFHTGLGAWGTHKLLIDYALRPGQRERLTRWFGPEAIEVENSEAAYQARGSLGPWCVEQRVAPDYLFAFAEFGTYRNLPVIVALRAENQSHHWGKPGDPSAARAKARLREVFCPASLTWRSRALAGGMNLVRRALEGLAGRP